MTTFLQLDWNALWDKELKKCDSFDQTLSCGCKKGAGLYRACYSLTLGACAVGYGSHSVCLSVCVCLLPWNLLYTSFIRQNRYHRFFMVFSRFCRVVFENAWFKMSGIIHQLPLFSLLPDELPMDRRDSDGFFLTKLVRPWFLNSLFPVHIRMQWVCWQAIIMYY